MKRRVTFSSLVMVAGTVVAGWGLFAPLVRVPIVGSVRYTESHLGGPELAWTIIALLSLAVGCCAFPRRWQQIGWLCFGGALGLAAGSLLAIYRGTMDQVQQVAEAAEIEALLAKMEIGPGLFALGAGLVLWTGGLIWHLWWRPEPTDRA